MSEESQDQPAGLVQRISGFFWTRCACFRHCEAPDDDVRIREQVNTLNTKIRDAVEASKPTTDQRLEVRDVTGRNQQAGGSLYEHKQLTLWMPKGLDRGQKGPLIVWKDDRSGTEEQGEVVEVRHSDAGGVSESLTGELGTVSVHLYNPKWKRQSCHKWKSFEFENPELARRYCIDLEACCQDWVKSGPKKPRHVVVCDRWRSTGKCSYGDQCEWSHSG
eukprot:TRINITY_DN50345_c0_g1_i1.p1 TRINITY_DN50345_c0_g1~~TRINITY_DN50345_c0_g1_i1.p1  ORF type:complete len:219 (-),score=32.11 TRINITY_DN50345_c0_g1_i1:73-729(-)